MKDLLDKADLTQLLRDPFKFLGLCWPGVRLYPKQAEIVQSVVENRETIAPAGNDLGKDYVSGFICVWFFCSRSPCRIVTHSVDHAQLMSVLWGEIRRFVETSRFTLPIKLSGALDVGIKQVLGGRVHPTSYLIGRVTRKGEGLLGHHEPWAPDGTPRTLFLADEASGVDQEAWERADTWAHRKLAIGNPYPPVNRFFQDSVEEGDLNDPNGPGCLRKIVHISAWDSPKVQFGLRRNGKPWSAKDKREYDQLDQAVPGVLTWKEFQNRLLTWDEVRQEIGLRGRFSKDASSLMYPPQWLDRAEAIADGGEFNGTHYPKLNWEQMAGECMGIDAAEGNDNTAWAIINQVCLLQLLSKKTQDTSDIPGTTIGLGILKHVPPERWLFDRGGGGKQHADLLRSKVVGGKRPYADVKTVGFGESATPPPKRHMTTMQEQRLNTETMYVYSNRRAEMYSMLRNLLNPDVNPRGFGLPSRLINAKRQDGGPSLREQMSKIKLTYDQEGRLRLPPKHRRDGSKNHQGKAEECLYDQLGCSPDELDALVLAVFGFKAPLKPRVQAMG